MPVCCSQDGRSGTRLPSLEFFFCHASLGKRVWSVPFSKASDPLLNLAAPLFFLTSPKGQRSNGVFLSLQMWTSTCRACLQCRPPPPTTTTTWTTTAAPLRRRGRPVWWDQRTTWRAKKSNQPDVACRSFFGIISMVSALNTHYFN